MFILGHPSQFLDRDTVLAFKMVPLDSIFFMTANWFELHNAYNSPYFRFWFRFQVRFQFPISNILIINLICNVRNVLPGKKKENICKELLNIMY